MYSPRITQDKSDRGEAQVRTVSIPASVLGWNARDSVANMPRDMAATLTNIFPSPTDMAVRPGITSIFVQEGGNGTNFSHVTSLLVYRPASGSQKMWVATDTRFIEVTGTFIYHACEAFLTTGWGTLTNATATGLANDATVYHIDITVDGVLQNLGITGSLAQTYGDLISELNSATSGATWVLQGAISNDPFFSAQSVCVYSDSTGSSSTMLLADAAPNSLKTALGGGFFNLHSPGTNPSVTSLTDNTPWQYVNMAAASANYLFAVNGTDSMRRYDSSNGWLTITGSGTGAITGVTTSTIINVAVLHNRLWLVPKNASIVWYLGTNAVAGAATSFDLGPLMSRGGYIVAAGGWSQDGGVGMQEYTVFVTSTGQAIVYQGYDPSNAALWSLVGVYDIGIPTGYRCLLKYSNDLLILTSDGLVEASKAFILERTNIRLTLTSNIQNAVVNSIQDEGTTTNGWGLTFYPAQQMLLLNVAGDVSQTYVMNTIHKAWCLFDGWDTRQFDIFNDRLYFCGGNGDVGIGYVGLVATPSSIGDYDLDPSIVGNSVAITTEWQPAFNSLIGTDTIAKEVEFVRPTIVWSATYVPTVLYGLDTDYVIIPPTASITLPTITTGGPITKTGARFGADPVFKMVWMTGSAIGYAFAPHFLITARGNTVSFNAIDVVYRMAGIQVQ